MTFACAFKENERFLIDKYLSPIVRKALGGKVKTNKLAMKMPLIVLTRVAH